MSTTTVKTTTDPIHTRRADDLRADHIGLEFESIGRLRYVELTSDGYVLHGDHKMMHRYPDEPVSFRLDHGRKRGLSARDLEKMHPTSPDDFLDCECPR